MKKTALYGKPKKKRSVTKIVAAAVLIALGVLLCVAAAIVEMRQYPWRQRLGLKAPDPSELPDPPALVPSRDAYFVFVVDAPSPAPDQKMEPPEILPGEEEPEEPAREAPAQETKKQYTVIGAMKIPALEISVNLLEGTGKELKYGVGHMPITAYPGQEGNCVIAGHRTYPFRYLDLLRNGDIITIRFGDKLYTYSVYDLFEVEPTETWVLNPVEGHPYSLTLITCTPYMVSSHRLIVRAELIKINNEPFEPGGTEEAQTEAEAGPGQTPAASPETTGGTAAEDVGAEGAASNEAEGAAVPAAAGEAEDAAAGGT